MFKAYCDSCEGEIKDMTEHGEFKIQEVGFSFVKHQKQGQVKGKEYIFCVDCARKIVKYFQEKIKEEK